MDGLRIYYYPSKSSTTTAYYIDFPIAYVLSIRTTNGGSPDSMLLNTYSKPGDAAIMYYRQIHIVSGSYTSLDIKNAYHNNGAATTTQNSWVIIWKICGYNY